MNKSMHILYIMLFLISCVIVFSSFYICEESWNTIVVSVGCGGIASVFIAWLIDWRNQKNTKKENEIKFEMILRQYVNLYRRFVWVTVNECHGLYQTNEQHTLKEWLSILSDESRYTSRHTPQMNRRCERLSANLINIQKYIEEFQNQSATLILNDFPNIEDLLDFFRIQHVHAWGSLSQLEKGNHEAFCDTAYILFKEFIEKFPKYKSEFPEKFGNSLLNEWKI